MNVVSIAKVCHQINKAYCEGIGDHSQKDWADAEQWQRDSAVKGVEFAIANPSATPANMHESWLAEKVATGWVYGPTKDTEAKTHHCMVPYEELPQAQKIKDSLFQAVVKAMT